MQFNLQLFLTYKPFHMSSAVRDTSVKSISQKNKVKIIFTYRNIALNRI